MVTDSRDWPTQRAPAELLPPSRDLAIDESKSRSRSGGRPGAKYDADLDATLADLALTIHAHPTLSEVVMEAANAALGKAVHALNRS